MIPISFLAGQTLAGAKVRRGPDGKNEFFRSPTERASMSDAGSFLFALSERGCEIVAVAMHASCQGVTVIPFVPTDRKRLTRTDVSRRLIHIATLRESLIHSPCRGSVASKTVFFER